MTYIVRVQGLVSPKGQRLNGHVGVVDSSSKCSHHNSKEERLPVWLDGYPEPIAILRKNICLLEGRLLQEWRQGVGRASLLSDQWKAVVRVRGMGKDSTSWKVIASRTHTGKVMGPKFRLSAGVLADAMQLSTEKQPQQHQHLPLVLHAADLNLVQAINLAYNTAIEEEEHHATLTNRTKEWGEEWEELLANIVRRKQKEMSQTKSSNNKTNSPPSFLILAKYSPPRVTPDLFTPKRTGAHRLQAVQAGAYHIYPCACDSYLDSLEVRYSSRAGCSQELFLDYGPQAMARYVDRAVALEALDRLSPSVLAQVDPQSFWSAVCHLKEVLESFVKHCTTLSDHPQFSELVTAWIGLSEGIEKSHKAIRIVERLRTGPKLLPDEQGVWVMNSKAEHKCVALRNAQASLGVLLGAGIEMYEGKAGEPYHIELMDCYDGSQLQKDILCITRNKDDPADMARIAMNLFIGLPSTAIDECATCHKTSTAVSLHICSRCECIAYCSRECQRRDWRTHQAVCNRIAGDSKIKGQLCRTRTNFPTKMFKTIEFSGIGALTLHWSGKDGGDNKVEHGRGAPTTFSSSDLNEVVEFQFIGDLDPLWRLAITCGPLPCLSIAQGTLDEALVAVNDTTSRLRVPSIGITVLEWAALRGNMSTVQWLCKDLRTRSLLKQGTPMGWAGFAGHIEILRYLHSEGADPFATDVNFWNRQHPFLAVAGAGQFEAMQLWIDEFGGDVKVADSLGRNAITVIGQVERWRDMDGHKQCVKWLKKKLGNSRG